MALEQEQQTYERELPNLRAQAGKWVLIHGDVVEGVYDTFNDALTVGYDKFGLTPFMVNEIEATQDGAIFTRIQPWSPI